MQLEKSLGDKLFGVFSKTKMESSQIDSEFFLQRSSQLNAHISLIWSPIAENKDAF